MTGCTWSQLVADWAWNPFCFLILMSSQVWRSGGGRCWSGGRKFISSWLPGHRVMRGGARLASSGVREYLFYDLVPNTRVISQPALTAAPGYYNITICARNCVRVRYHPWVLRGPRCPDHTGYWDVREWITDLDSRGQIKRNILLFIFRSAGTQFVIRSSIVPKLWFKPHFGII